MVQPSSLSASFSPRIFFVALLSLCVLVSGCSRQSRPGPSGELQKSGFLGDYSSLKPSKQRDAETVYAFSDPATSNLSSYDSIIIDPVSFWRGNKSGNQISEKNAQFLVDQFYYFLLNEIGQDLRIVSLPGPNTLRLQIAVTNPEHANQSIHTFTSVGTPARIISEAPELVASKASAVEALGLEAKLSNALTGEVYYMVVDRGFGRKSLGNLGSRTLAADTIIEAWAEGARNRLCVLRNQANCPVSSLG
jgi:hypothetical protein